MPKKILVIRFSSIGDIVLTSPVIRCLKSQLPDSEIHFLTKHKFTQLLEFDPNISKVIGFSGKLENLIPTLKEEQYDYIVDLHNNLRSRWIRFRLRKPGASFPKLNVLKWLWVQFKVEALPPIHVVDRYFLAAKALGIKNDGKGLSFFPCDCEKPNSDQLPEPFQNRPYVIFAIGGTHFTKRLPAHKWIELYSLLRWPVCIVGGKEDWATGATLVEAAKKTGLPVWNACGAFSIGGSAWLIQNSVLVFSNDTGMMHIAAAFKKPIVAFWGNTSPKLGMYPYETNYIDMEVADLSCRPCSKIGFDTCPKGHFRCMNNQDLGNPILANFLACIP
jgi:ADP-heptose:LPS heptosyltransferase